MTEYRFTGGSIAAPALPADAPSAPILRQKGKIRLKKKYADLQITIFMVCFTALAVGSFFLLDIDWARLASRIPDTFVVLGKLCHLNADHIGTTVTALFESVSVAILATVYSLVLGLVFAAFMARNLIRNPVVPALLSAMFALIRAVPTVVWVLLALVGLGFGPAPGIVGLCLHATAFFAKVFKQAFEEVPTGTLEALHSTGASRSQIFFSAVLPSALTQLIAWGSLRLETNVRESTILGMVGAGGIGYVVTAAMAGYNYGRAGTAILLLLTFSIALELGMNKLKRSVKVS